MKATWFIAIVYLAFSCNEPLVPKPKGYLSLNYPDASYNQVNFKNLPVSFLKNKIAYINNIKKSTDKTIEFNLNYPALKGTVYLTYKPIINKKEQLTKLLIDAQSLTQKHTIKADAIIQQQFIDPDRNVYGTFYEINGDAASQSQFYLTDSINHFLTGSLYFYVKPNFDSVFPAAEYVKKDIKRLMESLRWKEKQ